MADPISAAGKLVRGARRARGLAADATGPLRRLFDDEMAAVAGLLKSDAVYSRLPPHLQRSVDAGDWQAVLRAAGPGAGFDESIRSEMASRMGVIVPEDQVRRPSFAMTQYQPKTMIPRPTGAGQIVEDAIPLDVPEAGADYDLARRAAAHSLLSDVAGLLPAPPDPGYQVLMGGRMVPSQGMGPTGLSVIRQPQPAARASLWPLLASAGVSAPLVFQAMQDDGQVMEEPSMQPPLDEAVETAPPYDDIADLVGDPMSTADLAAETSPPPAVMAEIPELSPEQEAALMDLLPVLGDEDVRFLRHYLETGDEDALQQMLMRTL